MAVDTAVEAAMEADTAVTWPAAWATWATWATWAVGTAVVEAVAVVAEVRHSHLIKSYMCAETCKMTGEAVEEVEAEDSMAVETPVASGELKCPSAQMVVKFADEDVRIWHP